MNHLKEKCSGIDCSVKDIQTSLYGSLTGKWGEIDMYGRVYRNPGDRKPIPELFDGKEYVGDMYLDSKKRGTVFFIDGDRHRNDDNGLFRAEMKIVFILNLDRIFGPDRRDDRAQLEAFQSLENDVFTDFEITEIEKTIERVFSGFDTSKIKFDDMHPFHIFSINGNLRYELTNNC